MWAVILGWMSGLGSPAGGVAGFGDVASQRFHTSPVQWLVDNDITTGTSFTCFSPDEFATRGQASAFLWRMEGRPPGAPPHPFTDVTADWQQEPVSWMAASDITTGTSPSTYSPDDELTRGQLAALLHRLAGSPDAPVPGFGDVTTPWQITPIGWMVANGITTGTSPTTFSPDEPATRGQVAAFLYRFMGSPPVIVDPASPWCPPALATLGSATYAARCAVCHAANGSGGFGPSLIGTALTIDEIAGRVRNGLPGGMPSFTEILTPAKITAVAEFVSEL